ncbi:hypothetical protein BU26DRAFT_563292 [Trematosphaeria pertusa]|uniref:Uncharacterized protein n=1 Tax=Trematosphaeria pertusa TaxID=390896 RepID=A0A6A6ILP5_9PLEO|nr:uncharacterized protein BU26DRAFT_563292 [Trematosphaeria pertusa]KAF2251351.1 hypothetical protein BU26DRAFT_563292 [Trematosphaeria pertusa]
MPLTLIRSILTQSPPVAQAPSKFHGFLSLPRELRDRVYELAMSSLDPDFPIRLSMTLTFPSLYRNTLPGICLASRQTHTEATLIYISRTNFWASDRCTSQRQLLHFLAQFPEHSGFKAVRSLSWYAMKRFASSSEASLTSPVHSPYPSYLAAQCAGLTSLTVQILLRPVLRATGQASYAIAEPDAVDENLLLSRAAELKSLKTLKIIFTCCKVYAWVLGCKQEEIPRAYVDFLRKKFGEAGGRVSVEVEFAEDPLYMASFR